MSIANFLTEPATLVRTSSAVPDAEGNPTVTTTSTDVLCRLAQSSTSDDETEGDRRSTSLRLFLPADVELDGSDRVVKDGRTFEVEGSPYLARTPRGPHHWEVNLKEVSP